MFYLQAKANKPFVGPISKYDPNKRAKQGAYRYKKRSKHESRRRNRGNVKASPRSSKDLRNHKNYHTHQDEPDKPTKPHHLDEQYKAKTNKPRFEI